MKYCQPAFCGWALNRVLLFSFFSCPYGSLAFSAERLAGPGDGKRPCLPRPDGGRAITAKELEAYVTDEAPYRARRM